MSNPAKNNNKGRRAITVLVVILIILAIAAVGIGYYLFTIQDVTPTDTSANNLETGQLCYESIVGIQSQSSDTSTESSYTLSETVNEVGLKTQTETGNYFIGLFQPIAKFNANSTATYTNVKFIVNADEYTGQLLSYNELDDILRTNINKKYDGILTTEELSTFKYAQIDMSTVSDSLVDGANSLLIKATINDPNSANDKEAACGSTFSTPNQIDLKQLSHKSLFCDSAETFLRAQDTNKSVAYKRNSEIKLADLKGKTLYSGYIITNSPSRFDPSLIYKETVDFNPSKGESIQLVNRDVTLSDMGLVDKNENRDLNYLTKPIIQGQRSDLGAIDTTKLTAGQIVQKITYDGKTDKYKDKEVETCITTYTITDTSPIITDDICSKTTLFAVVTYADTGETKIYENGTEFPIDPDNDTLKITALSNWSELTDPKYTHTFDMNPLLMDDSSHILGNPDSFVTLPITVSDNNDDYINLLINTLSDPTGYYYLPAFDISPGNIDTFTLDGVLTTSYDGNPITNNSCSLSYTLLANGAETPDTSNIIVTVASGETCVERVTGSNTTTATATIRNADTDLEDVTKLVIKLPLGFTYTANSTRVNGTLISDSLVTQTNTGSTTDLTITPTTPWTLLSNQTMNVSISSTAGSSALTGTAIFEAIATPTNAAVDENTLRSQATLSVAQSCTSPDTGLFDSTLSRIFASALLIIAAVVFYKSNSSQQLSEKFLQSGASRSMEAVSDSFRLFGLRLTNPRQYFEEKLTKKSKKKK